MMDRYTELCAKSASDSLYSRGRRSYQQDVVIVLSVSVMYFSFNIGVLMPV